MITKTILWFKKKWRARFRNNVHISKKATTANSSFGVYVHIANHAYISNSSIQEYTSIGRSSSIINANVGKFCSISWNTTVGATQHPIDRLTTHAFPYVSMFDFVKKDQKFITKTSVGHDVWIGTGAVIMPGISIGHGAIVGANAVVTKDIEPYAIYAGVPAKKIGSRFDEKTVTSLLSMKWWNWSRKKIKDNLELFNDSFDIEKYQVK